MSFTFTLQASLQVSTTREASVPPCEATTDKKVCSPRSLTGLLPSLVGGRRIVIYPKHQGQRITGTKGRCHSLRPHLPFGKSYFPPFFFFVENGCALPLKYGLWFCPLWMLTVTRKRGLNLSNGSSPVLRPLWLAIQYICQAGGTLWLWGTGTGEMNERSLQQQLHSCERRLTWKWRVLLASWLVSCSDHPQAAPALFNVWSTSFLGLVFRERGGFYYSIWIRRI